MAQTTDDILKAIESDNLQVTSLMLSSLIEDHILGEGQRIKNLWKRYRLKDVPIYSHKVANYTKVNEKIAHDFYRDVVDTKTGYMGNEVSTSLNRESYKVDKILNEPEYLKDRLFLREWQNRTYSEDINSESVRDAGATGIGYRLLYIPQKEKVDSKPNAKIMNLHPWEVIYIYDQSLDEAVVALRYWDIESKDTSGKIEKVWIIEWYDKKYVTYYISEGDTNFHIDLTKGINGIDVHLFNGVPIIPFQNNGLETAEPEKVLDEIDAYDLITSATVSEIEQLRLAYMYIRSAGLMVDDRYMKQLEQTGIFALEEGGEVRFINKELAIEGVQIILDEIRKNIYEFSKSIDMSKEFGGDMRVIGWQVALLNMENSSVITERKFKKALRQQYILLTDYWREYQSIDINPYTIEFTFTRNFPRDIQAEAETLNLLLGAVSTETAYSQMSFIDDPEAEIKKKAFEDNPFLDDAKTAGSISLGDDENIQKKALNGAQVTALKDIVQAVSAGELTKEAAIDLIVVAFPDIGEEIARKMITSAGSIQIDGN